MSNPFKAGDKVVRLSKYIDQNFVENQVYTVSYVEPGNMRSTSVHLKDGPTTHGGYPGPWDAWKFRAAIKGQDYDVPAVAADACAAVYLGHLPDGSSVQAHSAGGLYPVVLVYRDKAGGPNADGKYDVGVISPKNQDPIWFKSSDAAIAVAEAIKANL